MELLKIIATILLIICLFIYLFIAGICRIITPIEIENFERLRIEVQKIDGNNAEAILGQAVKENRKLAGLKKLNSTWWGDLLIPDIWNKVEFIDIGE